MANFNTHLGVAAVGSGMLATLCLQVGLVNGQDALLLASMGVTGGILPDIDLHYSHPSRILFSLLGIICAFLWVFVAENDLPVVYLWGAGLGIYILVRYPIWTAFQNATVHRGAIHSIGVAVIFFFATAAISFHLFNRPAFISWLIAMFIFLGFLLHLLLDEIYSVDFMGKRLKRSFGTALKIVNFNDTGGNVIIVICIIGLWFITPDISAFIDTITSVETYRLISERLL